mmetsp:Transcript_23503/g.73553  ORF Transcript_23503/g.73553 Transcript_23503/m.73553 type:complete len:212 (+) Transcript_23503:600-1235(+)
MQLRRLGVVRAHFAAGSRFFQLAGKTQCGLGTQPVCITVSFRSDLPRNYTVHVFCPMCQDIFTPRSSRSASIDGAYFGTTFPHLFLMTFPELAPTRNNQNYASDLGYVCVLIEWCRCLACMDFEYIKAVHIMDLETVDFWHKNVGRNHVADYSRHHPFRQGALRLRCNPVQLCIMDTSTRGMRSCGKLQMPSVAKIRRVVCMYMGLKLVPC